MKFRNILHLSTVLILISLLGSTISAQTTQFTYQGSLNHNLQPANGNYDFEFVLFDSLSGGIQIGSILTRSNVSVSDGVFSVNLDFGSIFSGPNRFLEIRVTQTGAVAGGFTPLSPRQPVNSSPYAIRSQNASIADNANQLGGVNANQFVLTTDTRLSDARTPTSGSNNYIQNTTQQQTGNFDISGTGRANIFEATTQYNVNGNRVLSIVGTDNFFLGIDAGANITVGSSNSFFGKSAGQATTAGTGNSLFGQSAGQSATLASFNSFFGYNAGISTTFGSNSFFGAFAGRNNTTGTENSFFGRSAGSNNQTGIDNSFFGIFSGGSNTSGNENSFYGKSAGSLNNVGNQNSFFGNSAGISNANGNRNTIIGFQADVDSNTSDPSNATAIGANAQVTTSNSLVLGSINGVNSATADTNVGIGTTAPTERLHIAVNSGQILFGDAGCNSGFTGIGFGPLLTSCSNFAILGDGNDTIINRASTKRISFRINGTTEQMALNSNGTLRLVTLGSAGSTALCRNGSLEIATCSSSLRYKSNVESFTSGLDLVRKLRPVSFNWREGGMLDVGLVAEEVAEVEPLLTTTKDGRVEGVKYDRVGVVLVNAVKEQQEQIEALNEKGKMQNEKAEEQDREIDRLRNEVESLKAIVCVLKPEAAVCVKIEN